MAAINLLNIEPHKVSRDLSGYITFIYGAYKTGKTTLATQMDGALLLAFERGYNALPGVRPIDVANWSEMRQIYRELKKPEVQNVYKAVVVDTIDVAADKCKKYICQQNDIEELGDLPYGKGWSKFKDEFNEIFRGLTQLGYAVFFIGHDKEAKDNDGNITNIRSALSNSTREVIAGMADIYGYAKQAGADRNSILVLRDKTGFIECGCRFKYVPNEIDMNYQCLVNTIHEAIDKEAMEHGGKYVTDEPIKPRAEKEYDFDAMIAQINEHIGTLMSLNQSNSIKITAIIEKYLGKGKKVAECTPTQCEQLELIQQDLAELCK